MRKIFICILLLLHVLDFKAQAPKLINYQGIARDASGNVISGPVKIKFELFPVISGGTAAFSEIQTTNTNSLGIFSTQIGKVNPLNLSWNSGSWFLEISIDPTNTGSSFIILGRQQLVSVPFAFYAESAGSAPSQSLQLSGNSLSISGGNSVTLPAGATYTTGTGISINSGSIINTQPDQTVSISSGNNITVNGTYPNFSVTSNPSLSISGNSLSISGSGSSVTLPAGVTYTNGAGIAITSGSIITNSQPNQTVSILPGANVSINGAYPNFSVSSNPSLSISGNSLSISGSGSSVTLPAGVTYTNGAGITITSGSIITNSQPNQTITLSGVLVSGSYPNYTVNSPASTSVSGSSNISVTGSSPSFSINLQTTGVSAGIFGSSPNTVPTFSVDAFGRLASASSFTIPTVLAGNAQGPFNSTTVTAIQNVLVSSITPTVNQLLGYNGLAWAPTNVSLPVNFNSGTLTVGTSSALIPGGSLWAASGGTAIVATNTNNFLGIGTSTASHIIHTFGSSSSTITNLLGGAAQSSIRIHNDDLSNYNFSSIAFTTRANTGLVYEGAKIVALNTDHAVANISGDLAFYTRNPTNLNEQMRITSGGSVGIGVTNPSERLDVNGNIEIPAANDYRYAGTKTRYFSIPGIAFTPEAPANYNQLIVGSCLLISGAGAGSSGSFDAPVNLPDGATVTAVDAYVVDNDATYNINNVWMYAQPGTIGTSYGNAILMATVAGTSGPANPNIQKISTSTISNNVIDNQNNSYYVRIGMTQGATGLDMRLAKIVITYTIDKTD